MLDLFPSWYIILFGAVEIFISTTSDLKDMKSVRIITAGSGFGDLALLNDKV